VKLGIGLPNPVPNTPGNLLVDWARRAEAAGFSGLVTINRIAYPSYDSLTSLAAAAGFTEFYFDPTVATLDQIDRLAEAVL
jgi:alkanesulfonate monooxygenase SsuD/methylene tetrahydromethanopterin reductase-like flavin-dependent oxidoreductase (luciferase family)